MDKNLRKKYASYPKHVKKKILDLRELILMVAAETEGVGAIEESLKWNELSFNTTESKSGSPIRIDWKANDPNRYHLFVNCNTRLIMIFKKLFPNEFEYGGNRSISFGVKDRIPKKHLARCIEIAFTYKVGDYKNYRVW